MASSGSNMPGGFPDGIDNPYRAQHLDPRVDGGRYAPESSATTTANQPLSSSGYGTSSSAAPTTSTANTGLTGEYAQSRGTGTTPSTSAAHPLPTSSVNPSLGQPSTATNLASTGAASGVTTTADPASRSTDYQEAARTRVPDTSTTSSLTSTNQPISTSNPRTEGAQTDEPGLMTKMLGAVGLAGAGTTAASALGYSHKDEQPASSSVVDDTTHSSVHPDQSGTAGGPPAHYRRESIPTSAYPGGPNSPRPINAPVGGTRASQPSTPGTSTTGSAAKDVGLAAGVGTAALGAHEFESARGTPGAVGQNTTASSNTTSTAPATGGMTFHDLTTRPSGAEDTSSRRDAGLAGVGTAAAGAGVLGTTLPHRSQHAASKDSPIDAVAAAPGRYNGQDYTPQSASNVPIGTAVSSYDDHPHHAGRDAAPAAVAAAHERSDYGHRNTTVTDAPTGGALFTTGASPLSQAARTDGSGTVHDQPRIADTMQNAPTTQTEHHTGREAAVGAGVGAGAAIAADSALSGRHNQHHPNVLAGGQETGTGMAGPRHTGGAAHDVVDPAVARERARRLDEEEIRLRHEREAAAGVDTSEFTGTGAFAHEKHHHQHGSATRSQPADGGVAASTTTPGMSTHHHTERDVAVGAGAGAATGAATSRLSSDHTGRTSSDSHPSQGQKKPSIFRRIFKRRKNKDTGEDEEYSTDEEDHSHHGATGTAATAAGAGTAAEAAHHHHRHHDNGGSSTTVPTHHSDTKDRTVLGHAPTKYEELSGGATKPSYNPLKAGVEPGSADHTGTTHAGTGTGAAAAGAAAAGTGVGTGVGTHHQSQSGTQTGTAGASTVDPLTGTAQDVGPQAPGIGGDGKIEKLPDGRYIENITGMPYDPAKDPEAAARLRAMNKAGAVPGGALEGTGIANPAEEPSIRDRGRGEAYETKQ